MRITEYFGRRSKRRGLRTTAIAAAAAAALLVTACSGGGGSSSDGGGGSSEDQVVNIGWVPALGWAGFGALSLHEYDGFKVELLNFNSSSDILTALARGDLQMGIVAYPALAGALDQGATPKVQGVAGSPIRALSLISTKDSGVEDWSDLKGKTVGLVSGSQEAYQFQAAATAEGLEPGVDYKVLSFQSGADSMLALQRGDIVLTVTYEPLASEAVLGGYAEHAADPIVDGFYDATFEISSSVFASDSFIEENPDALEALVAQYVELQQAYEDPDVLTADFLQMQPGDDEIVRAAAEQNIANYGIDEEDLRAMITALHTFEVTSSDQTEAVVGLMNYSVLEKVTGQSAQELGKAS